MSEEVSRRAFEPFFTTKSVGVGTGLGLSVAYSIITQQHHGAIKLKTFPGQGACFIISLPRDGISYVTDDSDC
jgi:signal transduction histidine kinase